VSRRRSHARPTKKHGMLWAIIYIDLMTQIMIFFVILWTVERRAEDTQTEAIGTGLGFGDQTVRMVNLPGDVLFGSGKTELGGEGKQIIGALFGDADSGVLSFDQGGLATRKLAIHGHTDEVGDKDENFLLGYQRAWSVYQEIKQYGGELADHVIICTHADNTPATPVPPLEAGLTEEEKAVIREARAKNRRITIEDIVTAVPGAPEVAAAPGAGAGTGP
jgi:outer membrane protein OmpA-like peptidoglycan-associated protein